MKTILDVLNAMDEKLSDETKWTQGWYSKDAQKEECHPTSPEAVCWCLMGCIAAVDPSDTDYKFYSGLGLDTVIFLEEIVGGHPAGWNDASGRTFQEVKQLLQDAKVKAQEIPA